MNRFPSGPMVTVAIPVCNGATTIARAISFVAGQRYLGTIEILVCDAGSTDETSSISEPRFVSCQLRQIKVGTRARSLMLHFSATKQKCPAKANFRCRIFLPESPFFRPSLSIRRWRRPSS